MRPTAFVPTLLLALIFVSAKFALAWPLLNKPTDLSRVVTISAEDVAAALLFGVAASLALRATARRPALHRFAWRTLLVLAAVAAVYAVANVAVFHSLGYPLNARMFALVGRFGDLRSSLIAHCSVGLAIGMLAAALAFALAGHRRLRVAPSRPPAAILLAVAVGWIIWGTALRVQADPDAWARRAGKNPHRELLGSFASRLLFDRRVDVAGQFPQAYLADFRRAAEFARPPLPALAPPPRNVIMIVLESTSAQYMSLYGPRFDTTPNLLAESKHALVFDRAYAHVGYTYRSMVPLVNSVYPGLPWCYRPDMERPMSPGLAGVLKDRGYRTAFLGAANPEWGGMDWMAKTAGFTDIIGPQQLGGPEASSWGTEDGALVDGLLRWVDADRSRPFFAVAWTDQTHDPYTLEADAPVVDFLGKSRLRHAAMYNRYLNAIRQADRHLGRLFAALRDRGIADDTLVVITGDHGEAFADAHDVVSHGSGLFDECSRVPLMFWNPRLFPTGQRSDRCGGHVDINPTIAHLLGIDPPADWQGASLLSPDHPGRAYMLIDLSGYQFAVTDGRHKYVLHATDGFERLYDLREDPGEQRDESTEQSGVAAEMRARISAFVHAEEGYLNANRK